VAALIRASDEAIRFGESDASGVQLCEIAVAILELGGTGSPQALTHRFIRDGELSLPAPVEEDPEILSDYEFLKIGITTCCKLAQGYSDLIRVQLSRKWYTKAAQLCTKLRPEHSSLLFLAYSGIACNF
jgi:hypothetical protein